MAGANAPFTIGGSKAMTNHQAAGAVPYKLFIPGLSHEIKPDPLELDLEDMRLVHAVPERVTQLRRVGIDVELVHVGGREQWFWYVKSTGERVYYVPLKSMLQN